MVNIKLLRDIIENKKNITEFKRDNSEEKVDADFIKKLRAKLEFTQEVFASILGVSVKTIESWEQKRSSPHTPTKKLLYLLDLKPYLIDYLYKVYRYDHYGKVIDKESRKITPVGKENIKQWIDQSAKLNKDNGVEHFTVSDHTQMNQTPERYFTN